MSQVAPAPNSNPVGGPEQGNIIIIIIIIIINIIINTIITIIISNHNYISSPWATTNANICCKVIEKFKDTSWY